MTTIANLHEIASQVRRDIVRMVNMAGSGHPGGSLSSTDFLTALFFKELNNGRTPARLNLYIAFI
jgi:transketolase